MPNTHHGPYEKQKTRLELYAKLDEAEAESESGRGVIGHEELMQQLKSKLLG